MHIMNLGEFEELVHNVKCPLLFIFNQGSTLQWIKQAIIRLKGVYGERINIIDLDVTDNPGILLKSCLYGVPSMALYKDGEYKFSTHGLSPRDVEDMVRRYGECDE